MCYLRYLHGCALTSFTLIALYDYTLQHYRGTFFYYYFFSVLGNCDDTNKEEKGLKKRNCFTIFMITFKNLNSSKKVTFQQKTLIL